MPRWVAVFAGLSGRPMPSLYQIGGLIRQFGTTQRAAAPIPASRALPEFDCPYRAMLSLRRKAGLSDA
jgi:hypothetical protein